MPEERKPIPRYRDPAGPTVLSQGFRPFFLLAGLWAAGALALSIGMIQGRIVLPTAYDAVSWHSHEMLFGYVAATVTGFLLTAIPNWTGRLPLQGGPLLGLVGLWLAGRVAVAISALIGVWPAALIDLAFLAAVVVVTFREIAAGRNWRNLPVVMAVALFLICNALFHAEFLGLIEGDGLAQRAAVAVIVALITLIGGRIVPSFTRNWLVKQGAQRLPVAFGTFDRAVLITTLAALAFWTVVPWSLVAGGLMAFAAALNLARLARWCGPATLGESLLWVLHLGYLWIPLGLALLALAAGWNGVPASAALHALTAGAMGTMTLAVMSRAILGHTGRALSAGAPLTAAYVLVTLAALARVIAALWGAAAMPLLTVAAAAWIAAFVLFVAVCGPMLVTRRGGQAD
jgi:uncharacterized protein involved in response to NO